MAGALLLALAAATLPVHPAQAQIRRCTAADGSAVFTDRDCAALGAVEQRAPIEGSAPRRGWRGGCARRLPDLVAEVGTAIDARDGNRLAASYHWPGTGHRSGYAIAERLDGIAQRALLNVSVVYAEPAAPSVEATRPPAPVAPETAGALPPLQPQPQPEPEPQPQSQPQIPRRPIGLRVDQVLADGVTPSATTFGLRRHMDCWWISL